MFTQKIVFTDPQSAEAFRVNGFMRTLTRVIRRMAVNHYVNGT